MGEMRREVFWGLFLFSFLFPPISKIFPPKLGSGCRLSSSGLSLIPRTVVSSGVTCLDEVERACGHITRGHTCGMWGRAEAESHPFVVGIGFKM